MKTSTLTDFRSNMKDRLQEIEDDHDILILSGPKKRDFVVLTLSQFNAMEETAYLMSSPANALRLMESIEQDKAGQVTVRALDLKERPSRSVKRKSANKKRR